MVLWICLVVFIMNGLQWVIGFFSGWFVISRMCVGVVLLVMFIDLLWVSMVSLLCVSDLLVICVVLFLNMQVNVLWFFGSGMVIVVFGCMVRLRQIGVVVILLIGLLVLLKLLVMMCIFMLFIGCIIGIFFGVMFWQCGVVILFFVGRFIYSWKFYIRLFFCCGIFECRMLCLVVIYCMLLGFRLL